MIQVDFNSRLRSALLSSSLVSEPDAARAHALATESRKSLDQVLLRMGMVEEVSLLPLVCATLEIPWLHSITATQIDNAPLAALTLPYVRSKNLLPIIHDGKPMIALSDPANADLRTEVAFLLDLPVTFAGASSAQIRQALDQLTRAAPIIAPTLTDDGALYPEDGPVAAFVQNVLTDAVLAGASDIHFESTERGFSLRFRINGILTNQRTSADLPASSILARLKVLANLNVAERRLPQDGRLVTLIAGRRVDFRFSSLPTQWGESIVCRVLDPKSLKLGWETLGFPADIVAQVRSILQHPHGLFLVTGPTGSGKTTTLYTALAELNQPGVKIVTVEDPVEYDLPGVQQVQVHEEIGLSFARVLRSVLRHDPNVILVGEIRDQETAEIAVRAAQVGRLVMSTLHTNSAEGALRRLVDLGVPEFLARDVLRGVLGQRLGVVSCPACGGAGCGACGGSGAVGRRVEAELWLG